MFTAVEPLYEDVDSRETRTGRLGQALDIVTDSSSPDALDRASKWLAHCVENDKACEPPDDDFMPTHLIDVGSDSREPFLFKPSGPRRPYASLSYCWGPDVEDVLKTTTVNLKYQYESIPTASMAPAIQDAVQICRGLEIQYLWWILYALYKTTGRLGYTMPQRWTRYSSIRILPSLPWNRGRASRTSWARRNLEIRAGSAWCARISRCGKTDRCWTSSSDRRAATARKPPRETRWTRAPGACKSPCCRIAGSASTGTR